MLSAVTFGPHLQEQDAVLCLGYLEETEVVIKFCMALNFMLFETLSALGQPVGNKEGKGIEKGEVSGSVWWVGSLSQNLNGHIFFGWGRIRHLEQESEG